MPSRFPGMDPYLEAHWRDMHHVLCTYGRDSLNRQIAGEGVYRASVEERVVVKTPLDRTRDIDPAIRIVEELSVPTREQECEPDDGGVAGLERPATGAVPIKVKVRWDALPQGFVEIRRIARAYDSGAHESALNYDEPCAPSLRDEERAWGELLLRDTGHGAHG